MEQPNIFDYATSELSQDAFICYLLAFGKEEYKDTNLQEYKMAHDFLSLCNIDADEEIKEIKKQYKSIDVLIVTDKHLLIVEDKTGTGEHDDQIVRYVKELRKDILSKDKQIKVCYLKTQNYVYDYETSDKEILPQDCCRSLRRDDMLRLIKPNRQINLIFESFYSRLDLVNERVKACDDKNIFDWNEEKWFDYLSSHLKGHRFNLGWVNNAQGGFYGCWFDWKNAGNGEDYKQIEISFENGKTSKVKLCHKFSSENKETTVNSKSVIKDLQNKAVKNGFMPSNRIGRTTTYAYKTAQNKADVEAFIK